MPAASRLVAIDLGSNSFHLLLAQALPQGGFRIIARQRQKVRLADGLQANGELDQAAIQRGIVCLQHFRDYVAQQRPHQIRCVATAALRKASNQAQVIAAFEAALGAPIEVISGSTEARLIYQGASSDVPAQQGLLVIDIGGASSEIIVGIGRQPAHLHSFDMGCVIWQNRFFPDERFTTAAFVAAREAAAQLLQPQQASFQAHRWQTCVGASGTFRALYDIMQRQQRTAMTAAWLLEIEQQCCALGSRSRLAELGIRADRRAVFAGGLAILRAIVDSFAIPELTMAPGALREGLAQQWLEQRD